MALVPYPLARTLLFGLDPEDAHDLTLAALARIQHSPLLCTVSQPRIADPVTLAGLRFPNRIGLAAGLDKNGRCIDGFGAMGFGFVEVGTVTPKPQPGNEKPRMFRLPEARALINRFGFNNDGLEAFLANVRRANFRSQGGILGLNIGKNAATPIERAVDDYLIGLAGVYPHADYVTVNISSPNTKNLRALQSDEALDALEVQQPHLALDDELGAARIADLFSEEDLARHLQIMLRTHGELGYRQDQRFHLELGLLKMAHAQRLLPLEQLLSDVTPSSGPTPRPAGRPIVPVLAVATALAAGCCSPGCLPRSGSPLRWWAWARLWRCCWAWARRRRC